MGAHERSVTPVCNDERDEENLTRKEATNDKEYETMDTPCCGGEQGSHRVSSEVVNNAAAIFEHSPEPCPEEQFRISTKMGKQIAIAILLVSLFVISMILGVVLSQNQETTASDGGHAASSVDKVVIGMSH